MPGNDRIVRRLKLTAPSEAAARRVLATLEDALRCASLAGDDARVLVVRRLALGPVAPAIGSQALAALIERRMAEAGATWVDGASLADRDAEGAGCIAFASPLDARIELALRLVRGEPAGAWYWPRAVAEFDVDAGRDANLRRIAGVIAAWPEASAALPAWVAGVVQRCGDAALAMAVAAARVGSAPSQADRPAWSHPVATAPGLARNPAARPSGGAPEDEPKPPPAPVARRALRRPSRAAAPIDAGNAASAPRGADDAFITGVSNPPRTPAPPGRRSAAPRPAWRRAAVRPPTLGAAPSARRPVDAAAAPRRRHLPPSRPAEPTEPAEPAPPASAAAGVDAVTFLQPTDAAGLLFLLPVLARLGLPPWLDAGGDGSPEFARRVLHAALRRLRLPDGDPAWGLADAAQAGRHGPAEAPRSAAPAPAAWADALLGPPRGIARQAALGRQLAAAPGADARVALWLTAARRWLRRAGGIGLASLVLRPGGLGLTATHVDLHFRLADTDLRVRRLGLDVDPGWLPWYGRVVGFHFTAEPRR